MRVRSYMITIPFKYKDSIIKIKDIRDKLLRYDYFVFQLEKGNNTQYKHYQLYLENEEPIRFETIKNLLPMAHIEKRNGTKKQAFEYCTKIDTRLHGFWEFGDRPDFNNSSESKKSKKEEFLLAVNNGASDRELLLNFPTIFTKKLVDEYRNVLGINLNQDIRDIKVTYIFGLSGVGKSSYIRRMYKANDIYIVSDYERDPFGSYNGQKCIVFEEFRSNFPLSVFLQYLDIYPLSLPSRYQNKQALYTDIYIISNWTLDNQYINVPQVDRDALLRRIKYRIDITTDYIYRSIFDNGKFVKSEWIFNPVSSNYENLINNYPLDMEKYFEV